jgi:hypothetical protein
MQLVEHLSDRLFALSPLALGCFLLLLFAAVGIADASMTGDESPGPFGITPI